MTKLYHNGEPEGWQIPGNQDKRAERVDVPSSPAELAAWLNVRDVSPRAEPAASIAAGDFDQELDAAAADAPDMAELARRGIYQPGGAVLTAADVAKVNDGRPSFMPRLDADEIERRRMAMGQCPKCSSAPSTAVRSWIAGLAVHELRWIRNVIGDQLEAIGEEREQA
jgi:hypothetical protein